MKRRIVFLVLAVILVMVIACVSVVAAKKSREVYLQGTKLEDGTVLYEGEDGMSAIVGEWQS